MTLFTQVQKNGRDARRQSDVDAIAKALETNKTPGATTYKALVVSMFAGAAVPTDPGSTTTYCVNTGATAPQAPDAAGWTSGCPSGWSLVGVGSPADLVAAWTICARLESGQAYCKYSSQ